jgi:ribosomal protein S18 acetylase RimI-like enzyme
MVEIRRLTPEDEPAAASLLHTELGGRHQARLGELHDVLAFPGFGAWDGGSLVGVATYRPDGDRAELAAIAVAGNRRLGGIGSLLIEAVAAATASEGLSELWLVTTNDNLDALRLYQRRGFQLTELHQGAMDEARKQKPAIPELGHYGIPMRDELVLTLVLLE